MGNWMLGSGSGSATATAEDRQATMINAAKPTAGPWRFEYNDHFFEVRAEGRYRGGICNVHSAEYIGGITRSESEANASLIAEAGTVYHETGLTPRELAEQRAELLEALEWANKHIHGDIEYDNSDDETDKELWASDVLARAKGKK